MATSSLTHNFVISDPDAAERFVAALEASEPFRTPLRPSKSHQLTDKKQIFSLFERIASKKKVEK